jgi:hypothetical protein
MALARAQAHELAGGRPSTSWTLSKGMRLRTTCLVEFAAQISIDADHLSHSTIRETIALARASATRDIIIVF